MRNIEAYEHIQIPDDYDLYASEIKQIENICRKESPDGNIHAINLIVIAFKLGFKRGSECQIKKNVLYKRKQFERMERLLYGKN